MAHNISISYRRDDSGPTAGRLYDRLAEKFGEANIFIDVDNMPAGVDFVKHLNKQVENCDLFLCAVGPNWLSAKDEDGHRRLDQPDDYVRVEIAAALNRDIPVIPVLIDGGIRRGTDVVKAVALGATAVMIGRPYCYGLAACGAAGVQRVIEILRNELEMAMQLMGRRTLKELDPSALAMTRIR